MNANQAKQKFEILINNAVPSLIDLTVDRAVTLMLDFYRHERADDCELANDGDMLLYQWGTYDWGEGKSFEFDLTRQFIVDDGTEDDDVWQLSLTFKFLPTNDLVSKDTGNRWCNNPDPASINEFETFIRNSAAYEAALAEKRESICLEYFNAG